MASSRVVSYTDAKPKNLKVGLLDRWKFGLTKFGQAQTGKRKESLKKAKEDFGHNVNFAVTNQLVHATTMALSGAAIASGIAWMVHSGKFIRGEAFGAAVSGIMEGVSAIPRRLMNG